MAVNGGIVHAMIMTRTRPTACPGSGGGALVETCNVDRRGKKDGTRGTRGGQRGRLLLPPLLFPRPTPLHSLPPSLPLPSIVNTLSQHLRPSALSKIITPPLHSQLGQEISSINSLLPVQPPRIYPGLLAHLLANSHWRSDDPSPSTTCIWTTHTSNFP